MNTTIKKVECFSTKNYSQFNLFATNRKVEKGHLNRMVDSIKTKNLLYEFPITVNHNFFVLDGQTRLEACKLLNIPVVYRISKDMEEEDISLINSNSKSWKLDNYLNLYVTKGFQDYLKIKKFMDINEMSLTNVLVVIKGWYASDSTSIKKEFKNGVFKYPNDDSYMRSIVAGLENFENYFGVRVRNVRSFVLAYIRIKNQENYDEIRMRKKLEAKKKIEFPLHKDVSTYIAFIEDIYNYKLRDATEGVWFKK